MGGLAGGGVHAILTLVRHLINKEKTVYGEDKSDAADNVTYHPFLPRIDRFLADHGEALSHCESQ